MKPPRIILADDHVILLDAIKNSLEKDFDVVGTFTDGRTLVNGAAALKPDLIVLDVSMPQMNGLMAAARLKEILPNWRRAAKTRDDHCDAQRNCGENCDGRN